MAMYNTNTPITFNTWCEKYKVSSRLEKTKTMWQYRDGEYDCIKFAKMVKSYDKKNDKKGKWKNIWKKIRKTFLTLCSR